MDTSNRKRELGTRLRGAREKAGIKQQDAADAAGITVRQLYNLEHGIYSALPASFQSVCQAVGVDPDDLTTGLPDDEPEEAPAASPEEADQLLRTLMRMPREVRWAMFVLGGRLSRMSPERRSAEVDRIMREMLNNGE